MNNIKGSLEIDQQSENHRDSRARSILTASGKKTQHGRLMWWVGWDIKIGEIRQPLGSLSPISRSFIAPNGSLLDLGAHLGKAGSSMCCDCSALARPKTGMRSCLRECSITQRGLIIRLLILSYRAKAPSLTFTATCIGQHSLLHVPRVPGSLYQSLNLHQSESALYSSACILYIVVSVTLPSPDAQIKWKVDIFTIWRLCMTMRSSLESKSSRKNSIQRAFLC